MKITSEMGYAIADAADDHIEYEMLGSLVESIDDDETPCWANMGAFAVYIAPVGKTTWDFKIFRELAHTHAVR